MADRPFLATRLLWVFRTSGGPGVETGPVDELEPSRRAALLAVAQPTADDIVLIGYYHDDARWLLLTLDRLRAQHAGHRIDIATSDIATARSTDVRGKQPGADATIEVVLTSRETRVVGIESGAPLLGMLNVLKRIL